MHCAPQSSTITNGLPEFLQGLGPVVRQDHTAARYVSQLPSDLLTFPSSSVCSLSLSLVMFACERSFSRPAGVVSSSVIGWKR